MSLEFISASGEVEIQVMAELCQRLSDGLGMPAECILSIVVQNFMRKGDIRNCKCNTAVNFVECGMKVVEKVFKNGFI